MENNFSIIKQEARQLTLVQPWRMTGKTINEFVGCSASNRENSVSTSGSLKCDILNVKISSFPLEKGYEWYNSK